MSEIGTNHVAGTGVNAQPLQPPSSDAYGRIDVTIPQATYEAGKLSTVSIVIRNPFNRPVDIVDIQGPRSSYLEEIGPSPHARRDPSQGSDWWSKIRNYLTRFYVSEIRVAGITAEFPKQKRSFNISADPNAQVVVDTDLSEYDSVNVSASEGSTVKFSPQSVTTAVSDTRVTTIEPHCEAVAYFQVRTSGWLFFTPTRQTLSTQIRYRIDGRERTQVASTEFEMKPPLRAIVIGAVLGAILGTLAKSLKAQQTLEWQPIAIAAAAAIVMSLIASIALSRKTAAQAFITVEDFFGGFVIGALIGYGGSQYFEKAILPESGANKGS